MNSIQSPPGNWHGEGTVGCYSFSNTQNLSLTMFNICLVILLLIWWAGGWVGNSGHFLVIEYCSFAAGWGGIFMTGLHDYNGVAFSGTLNRVTRMGSQLFGTLRLRKSSICSKVAKMGVYNQGPWSRFSCGGGGGGGG